MKRGERRFDVRCALDVCEVYEWCVCDHNDEEKRREEEKCIHFIIYFRLFKELLLPYYNILISHNQLLI